MAYDVSGLKKWLGEKETAVDYVTVPTVHRLSALLDRDDPFPRIGDPLPIGWHAVLFPRVVRHSQIGPDGHPARGDFLPPVPLPRRMWAGIGFPRGFGRCRCGTIARRARTAKLAAER